MLGTFSIFAIYGENTAMELSQRILSGLLMVSTTLSPEIKFRIHNTWIITSKYATNSAFIMDEAMTNYFWHFSMILFLQLIGTTSQNRLLLSTYPAKFESEYLTTPKWLDLLWVSMKSLVHCRYHKTFC